MSRKKENKTNLMKYVDDGVQAYVRLRQAIDTHSKAGPTRCLNCLFRLQKVLFQNVISSFNFEKSFAFDFR